MFVWDLISRKQNLAFAGALKVLTEGKITGPTQVFIMFVNLAFRGLKCH